MKKIPVLVASVMIFVMSSSIDAHALTHEDLQEFWKQHGDEMNGYNAYVLALWINTEFEEEKRKLNRLKKIVAGDREFLFENSEFFLPDIDIISDTGSLRSLTEYYGRELNAMRLRIDDSEEFRSRIDGPDTERNAQNYIIIVLACLSVLQFLLLFLMYRKLKGVFNSGGPRHFDWEK